MKSRSEIWLTSLEELGDICSVDTSKDAKYVLGRIAAEGDSFLTVALPRFADDLQRSLAYKGIPRDAFQGWERRRVGFTTYDASGTLIKKYVRGAPKFLGGFLDQLFYVKTDTYLDQGEVIHKCPECSYHLGEVHPERHVEPQLIAGDLGEQANAIWAMRQLCLSFSKEFAVCAPERVSLALDRYVEIDEELDFPLRDGRAETLFKGGRLDRIRKVINVLFRDLLLDVSEKIWHQGLDPRVDALRPKHGPGATSQRLMGNEKWIFREWPSKLEYHFPFLVYGIANERYHYLKDQVEFLEPGTERPSRVIAVPKTPLKPRLIAAEPVANQFVQQALFNELASGFERDPLLNRIIGLHDQSPNQAMAQAGSDEGQLATLDLSDASDRLANWLVEDLFAEFPRFLEGIQACRTETAQLPSGRVITLQKFASMGSALTFPLEAMVFLAVALEAVLRAEDLPVSRYSINKYRDQVRVYGDDIIVPTHLAETVMDSLELVGFKVNRNKSFWTGNFRESCGKEFWNGYDVSVVKFRSKIPSSLHDAAGVISFVKTRNLLYQEGLLQTAEFLDSHLEKILRGHYPVVEAESPVLGRIDSYAPHDVEGFDENLQDPRVLGFVVTNRIPKRELDGEYALLKCLSNPGLTEIDPKHLERSGRGRGVKLNLAWARPF